MIKFIPVSYEEISLLNIEVLYLVRLDEDHNVEVIDSCRIYQGALEYLYASNWEYWGTWSKALYTSLTNKYKFSFYILNKE